MNHSTQHPDEYAAFTTPTNHARRRRHPGPTRAPRGPPSLAHVADVACPWCCSSVPDRHRPPRPLGGLIYAAGCLLLMGLMMAWMNHGNNQPKH